MITTIVQALLRKEEAGKLPVLLMLDEASLLSDLPVLEQSMALMRNAGVKLFSVYQDVGQAEMVLGQKFNSYVENATIIQGFAPRLKTARFLAETAGEKTTPIYSHSSKAEGAEANMTIGVVKTPVLRPEDVMYMDKGFSVVYADQVKGAKFTYFPDPRQIGLKIPNAPRFDPDDN